MGIKNFTKVISPTKELTMKSLRKNEIRIIAIDAMSELYRAFKSPVVLTDDSGNYTHHISILLSNIIERKKNNISEIWVFDYFGENDTHYNPMKESEYIKRSKLKESQKKRIKKLASKKKIESDTSKVCQLDKKISNLEKNICSFDVSLIKEFMLILNSLNIPYIISPKGFEAEHVAACLTQTESNIADAVYSSDADALLFGAKRLILRRRDYKKKKTRLLLYDLKKTLEQYELDHIELIKMGIVMGCDFYHDTDKLFYRIGPKTVIKRIKSKDLDDKFKNKAVVKVIKYFNSECNFNDFQWFNTKGKSFNDKKKINNLIQYLISEKKFSSKIWLKKFDFLK